MALFAVGCVHEDRRAFVRLLDGLPTDAVVVQCGDLPLYPQYEARLGPLPARMPRTVYMIDGNQHWYPQTAHMREPQELRPGLVFVPRGVVLRLDGRRVGFLGGGDTSMPELRIPDIDYFPELESVTDADVTRLLRSAEGTGGIDVLVTHAPPRMAVQAAFGADTWIAPSSEHVQRAWEALGRPRCVSSHIHTSLTVDNVTVLAGVGVTAL